MRIFTIIANGALLASLALICFKDGIEIDNWRIGVFILLVIAVPILSIVALALRGVAFRTAQPGASPNGGPAVGSGKAGAGGGPPSVS